MFEIMIKSLQMWYRYWCGWNARGEIGSRCEVQQVWENIEDGQNFERPCQEVSRVCHISVWSVWQILLFCGRTQETYEVSSWISLHGVQLGKKYIEHYPIWIGNQDLIAPSHENIQLSVNIYLFHRSAGALMLSGSTRRGCTRQHQPRLTKRM